MWSLQTALYFLKDEVEKKKVCNVPLNYIGCYLHALQHCVRPGEFGTAQGYTQAAELSSPQMGGRSHFFCCYFGFQIPQNTDNC